MAGVAVAVNAVDRITAFLHRFAAIRHWLVRARVDQAEREQCVIVANVARARGLGADGAARGDHRAKRNGETLAVLAQGVALGLDVDDGEVFSIQNGGRA